MTSGADYRATGLRTRFFRADNDSVTAVDVNMAADDSDEPQ